MNKLISTDPGRDFEVIGEIDISTRDQIVSAVKVARSASQGWSTLSVQDRVAYLRTLQTSIRKKKDQLAPMASREIGMPIRYSRSDIDDALDNYMEWYLENAEHALSPEVTYRTEQEVHENHFEASGVAAVISPWNFPASNFVWGVIPNLVVGNTVVYKHSEECPLSSKIIAEAVKESSLPSGVLTVIFGGGDVGQQLLKEPIDLISFTGSSLVGGEIYKTAGKKFIKCVLELGGSAAGIVCKDADLDASVENIFSQRFFNAGQICDGLKRLIVHKDVLNSVTQKLIALAEQAVVGNAEDESTEYGPLVSRRQYELALAQLEDAKAKGAQVVYSPVLPASLKGAYMGPTLLAHVTRDMRVWTEEVFAPILPIVPFETEDEAIELANDTLYGLGGYIYSGSQETALRLAKQMRTGMISVNGTSYVRPCNVFGGMRRSGKGREHGIHGLRELCEIKLVARPL